MTHAQKKPPQEPAAEVEGTEVNRINMLASDEPGQITAAPRHPMRRKFPRAVEPFPGRALAIRTARSDGELAMACVRYAGALLVLRAMCGRAPDLACEVVADSVAQHVRHCAVQPKPSRRQVARAVEAAFAVAERAA